MVFELNFEETVGHMKTAEPMCVEPDATIRSVLDLMREHERGSVSICRNERLIGIFTERDALKLMATDADLDVAIETVMTANPETVALSDDVLTVINKMSVGGYRRLPVVDADGKPVGLLKVSTVLHYLVEHFPAFVYNLPPNPKQKATQREGA